MKRARYGLVIGLTALAGFVAGCGGSSRTVAQKSDPSVTLTPVSAAGLDRAIAEQKGKVVYIDAWFLACPPCVEAFPHVVELHKKYAADGLVVMSVDVGEKDFEKKEKVLEFLQKQGASFPNYVLEDREAAREWQRTHKITFTPWTILIDRNGKQVPFDQENTPHDEIEAVMKKLLASK